MSDDNALKPNDNFLDLEEFLGEASTNYVALAWSSTGVGKSDFCLTGVPPIYLESFEPDGPVWAIKNAFREGRIQKGDLFVDEVIRSALGRKPPIVRTDEEDEEIYDYFMESVQDVIDHADGQGTICIDTSTTMWQIMQSAEFTKAARKNGIRTTAKGDFMRFNYRYPNAAMKKFLDAVRASGLNIIFTAHADNDYNSKGEELKTLKYTGMKELPNWVDISVQLVYNEDEDQTEAIVKKCRLDRSQVGVVIEKPTLQKLYNMLEPV